MFLSKFPKAVEKTVESKLPCKVTKVEEHDEYHTKNKGRVNGCCGDDASHH